MILAGVCTVGGLWLLVVAWLWARATAELDEIEREIERAGKGE